jgi:glycine cleavage system transcriptional repressor
MSVALVSILGPDRVGLVAAVADALFGAGVSLRDTTFAALGSGAEFTAICDLPEDVSPEEVETALTPLPELTGAQVRVAPYAFDPNPTALARVTHRIAIAGGDQLGLVARLAEIFGRFEANIVRLEARKLSDEEGGLYVTRFAVAIAPDRRDLCLAAVTSTAGALSLTCRIEASEI